MRCLHCDLEKIIAGHGLCRACYSRLRRSGSLARRNVQRIGACSIDGCDEPAFSKGFCSLHYFRQRPPLYGKWKTIRSSYKDQVCDRWQVYENFIADVGLPPSPKHQLRRKDNTKEFSPDNIKWVAPVSENGAKSSSWTAGEKAEYSRRWMLKNRYGLTSEDYEAKLAEQDGKCAICKCEEAFINTRTGRPQDLSVDHDHKTHKVRGLLCVGCNRMLGYARDDKDTLKSAIAYLERYGQT